MKYLSTLAFLMSLGACATQSDGKATSAESTQSQNRSIDVIAQAPVKIGAMLDDWHKAASEFNADRYFGYMIPDGIFMGTDATEYWTKSEFETLYRPYFESGKGWTYVPKDRNLYLSGTGEVAWFDEKLDSPHMGEARGSGVVVYRDDKWMVAHYNLTVPVPNDIMKSVVKQIADFQAGATPTEPKTE